MKKEKFSQIIKEARVKKGLLQSQVASAIGINAPNYNTLENGRWAQDRFISQEKMIKTFEFLGLDADYMLALIGQVRKSKVENFIKQELQKYIEN